MNRIEDVYGLTPVQEGIYAQYFREKTTDAYHLYYLFSISESTDLAVLQQALNLLVLRHPVLKSAFAVVEGTVKQVILADRLPKVIVRRFAIPYAPDALNDAVQEETARRFDPQGDSLLCCTFLLFDDARFLFVHTHHLIFDGWCTSILFEDLTAYYRALADGEPIDSIKARIAADRAARSSFASFVSFVRQHNPREVQQYWRTLLENWTPVSLPRTPKAVTNVPCIRRISPPISPKLRQRTEAFARSYALPLNAVLESAFALAIQKHSGCPDVVFNKVVSGRSFGFPGIERTLGPMINTVPVRSRREDKETPRAFLLKMHEQAIHANVTGFLPLADVFRSSGIAPEAVDVLFDYGNYLVPSLHNTQPLSLLEAKEQTEFPLTCIVSPDGESLHLTAIFDSNCFSPVLIQSLVDSFLFILEQFCRLQETQLDDSTALSQMLQLTEAEHEMLFGSADVPACSGFCTGECVSVPEQSVYALFAVQAASVPDALRITDVGETYSFTDLRIAAEKTDAYIRSRVGGNKQVIGILCDRSYHELAAIFGVIRGGNAYLPISPQYPPERIRTMLETSGCKLVLAQKQFAHLVDYAGCVEDILAQPMPDKIPDVAAKPEDTLYVIYTSGSTGTPKGAMVSNRSAVNRIQWMATRYFDDSTVVMRKTPYTFDVSVWEIFGFAMFGFSLYILPPESHYNQNEILAHIQKGRITDLHFVPTVFEQFLSVLKNTPDVKHKLRSVRHVILSGESLLAKDVNTFRQYHDGQITVHNLYGPAECAVDVTAYDCAETETDPIPIGKPIANTQIYILDKYLEPVPIGVMGELCVAGDNVGQGYLNRSELTKEKFVDNPFGEGKLYKTGDLAFWREDGNIIFVGRNDFQVKINGQRVELGDIEATLSVLDGINSAAVIVKKDETDRQLICAFYTGKKAPVADLRTGLGKFLPRYMIPQAFTHLEAMPLTTSGKIDRLALDTLPISIQTPAFASVSPQNETEQSICNAFSTVLGQKKVSREANFFDLGGTSLQLVRLLSCPPLDALTPSDFLADPTPAGLAKRLDAATETDYTYVVPLYTPRDAKGAVVLFPYAGGDASAYTALAAKAHEAKSGVSLLFVDWPDEKTLPAIAEEIRLLTTKISVCFYSHCAGCAIAMTLLDTLNKEAPCIRHYIAGGSIPPRKALARFNAWTRMPDSAIVKALEKAGLHLESNDDALLRGRLERFRRHTQICSDYFRRKTAKTNVTVTAVLSREDPFTPNYADAETRWCKVVADVDRVILIDTPSHYFQNTDTGLLLNLFSELPL